MPWQMDSSGTINQCKEILGHLFIDEYVFWMYTYITYIIGYIIHNTYMHALLYSLPDTLPSTLTYIKMYNNMYFTH